MHCTWHAVSGNGNRQSSQDLVASSRWANLGFRVHGTFTQPGDLPSKSARRQAAQGAHIKTIKVRFLAVGSDTRPYSFTVRLL